jgi:hypothetical protein
VAFIAAHASTEKEVNQTPPWTRYTKDHQEVREDWALEEAQVVPAPPGAPPGPKFCLGAHVCVSISVMIVSVCE